MEIAAFVIWCFLVALGGGLVGLVLGNLRLPAVLLLASSPAAAGGANIAISGVASATASGPAGCPSVSSCGRSAAC